MVIYPHQIKVTREVVDTDDMYADPQVIDIWEGSCCNQVGSSGEVSDVVKSDYTAYFPTVDVEFKKGDKTVVIEKEGYSPIVGEIKQCEFSEMGTTLWILEYGN